MLRVKCGSLLGRFEGAKYYYMTRFVKSAEVQSFELCVERWKPRAISGQTTSMAMMNEIQPARPRARRLLKWLR